MEATTDACPYEIWECIFKLINGDNRTLEALSVVSKQFLYIINHVRCVVTISEQTIPFIPRLFQRFPHLTSLNLSLTSQEVDLDALLCQISTFSLDIKSLYISNPNYDIPEHGLRALSKKMKNLTSLTCSTMGFLRKDDIFLIADCFPLLEELNLTWVKNDCETLVKGDDDEDYRGHLLALPKLRKINLHGTVLDQQSVNYLCQNCELLQEVNVITCTFFRKKKGQGRHIY
ncbi:putative leucine-rich repeat domain, L domain-containing protein [Medicago truncatula]|uniref:Putative leucine-rich repeat domain, L domain-containing protein n=1 Tax=Medicago truncatula TaxID=3880 RepID=A0A396HYW1_MEDTR|nr:putative leucine-rich repeat domain, L domain-containing protein [Medicago truncatula]